LQLGHNYIGTEHILLGLIREGEGVAAQVLVRLGADLNRVRQQTVDVLLAHKARSERSGLGEIQVEEEEEAVMPRRVVAREFWLTEIQDTLAKITDRLTAIERHLGMTAHPAGQDAPGTEAGEKPEASPGEEPEASSGGEPGDDAPGDGKDAPGDGKAVGE
jgi:ATP-dependent Clp protease ATP-binding subunit ClpA